MSRIKELIKDDDSILVFDIDGVLAIMEFGERNHFLTDEEWSKKLLNKENVYVKEIVSSKIQKFLKTKNMNNIYVLTKIDADIEKKHKEDFASNYYNIRKENVYCVKKDSDKVKIIKEIRKKHLNVSDEKIIMIDDSVDVLNDILNETYYSTAHISSFLDIL